MIKILLFLIKFIGVELGISYINEVTNMRNN